MGDQGGDEQLDKIIELQAIVEQKDNELIDLRAKLQQKKEK